MSKTRIQKLKWAVFALFIGFCAVALGFASAFHKNLTAYAAGSGQSFLNNPSSTPSGDSSNVEYNFLNAPWVNGTLGKVQSSGSNSPAYSDPTRIGRSFYMSTTAPTASELRKAKYMNYIFGRKYYSGTESSPRIPEILTSVPSDETLIPDTTSSNDMRYQYISWGNNANSGIAIDDYMVYYITIDLDSIAQKQLQSGAISSISATLKVPRVEANGDKGDARLNAFMTFAKGSANQNLTSWTSSAQTNQYTFVYSNPGGNNQKMENLTYTLSLSSSDFKYGTDNLLVIGVFAKIYFTNPWNWSSKASYMWCPAITAFSVTSSVGNKSLSSGNHHASSSATFNGVGATFSPTSLATTTTSLSVDTNISSLASGYFFMGYNVYLKSGTEPLFLYKKKLKVDYSDDADIRMDAVLSSTPNPIWMDAMYGTVPTPSVSTYTYTGSPISITTPSLTNTNTTASSRTFNTGNFRTVLKYADQNGNNATETAPTNIGTYTVRVEVYYNETAVQNATQSNWNGIKSTLHIKKNMTNDNDHAGLMLGHSAWQTITIKPREVTLSNLQTDLTFNGNDQRPAYSVNKNELSGKTFNVGVSDGKRDVGSYNLTLTIPSNIGNIQDGNGKVIYTFKQISGTTVSSDGLTITIPFTIKRYYLDWTVAGGGSLTYNGAVQNAPFTADNLPKIADTDVSLNSTGVLSAKDVGNYTAQYSLAGTDANNYTFSESAQNPSVTNVNTVSKDWSITPATITVTPVLHLSYSANRQKPTFTATGWQGSDSQNVLLDTSALTEQTDVDDYEVTFTLEDGKNYIFDNNTYSYTFTWSIDQVDLIFTAKSFSNTYGNAVPDLVNGALGVDNPHGFTVVGYKGSDNGLGYNNLITLSYFNFDTGDLDINQYSKAGGTYSVVITVDESKITDTIADGIERVKRNYNIQRVVGTYTVTPRSVAYTADNQTIDYGDTVTLTGNTLDDVLKHDVAEGNVTVTLSHNAGTSTGGYLTAGTNYQIIATLSGNGAANYDFTGTPATLKINQKTVKVKLSDFELTYGDELSFDGQWDVIEGDFLSGDDVQVLPHFTSAPAKLTVSSYDAVVDFQGNDASNYNPIGVYETQSSYAVVTVNRKQVTYRIDSVDGVIDGTYGDTYRMINGQWISYGTTLSGNLADGSTMAYDDSISLITDYIQIVHSEVGGSGFAASSSGHLKVNTEGYELSLSLVPSSYANRNYKVVFDGTVKLRVNPRPITVRISDMSVMYGDFYPTTLPATLTGSLAEGDDLTDLWSFKILDGENEIATKTKYVEWEGTQQPIRFIIAAPGGSYVIKTEKTNSELAKNYTIEAGTTTQTFSVTKRVVALSISGLDMTFGTDAATEDGINNTIATCITVPDPIDRMFPEFESGQMPFAIDSSNLKGVTLYEVDGKKYFPAGSYSLPISVAEDFSDKYEIQGNIRGALQIDRGRYNMDGVAFESISPEYDGNAHRPQITGTLPTGIDGVKLSVSYSGFSVTHVADGEVTVTASFMTTSGNYYVPSQRTATAKITPRPITVKANDQSAEYCGSEAGLGFNAYDYSVTAGTLVSGDSLGLVLTKETGYAVNTQGYRITFTADVGNTDYNITKNAGLFRVLQRNIENASIEVRGINSDGYVYTGSPINPSGISLADRGVATAQQVLRAGSDYLLGYADNINVVRDGDGNILAGAKLSFSGQGNYTGSFTVYFKIVPKDIAADILVGNIAPMTYNGNPQTPTQLEVRDSKRGGSGGTRLTGDDYSISYENNTNAGNDARVILTGKGNYTGSYTVTYTILPCDVKNLGIASISNQEYRREQILPTPAVTLNSVALRVGQDFSYTYGDNTNVGEGIVTVTGRGNFTGSRDVTFQIVPRELTVNQSNVKDLVYSGNPQDVSVTFEGYIQGDRAPKAQFTYYDATTELLLNGTPEDVGSYFAVVKLEEGVINYHIESNIRVYFKITPYEVKANWTIPKEMVYNGAYQRVRCDANMGLTDIKTKADISIVYYYITGEKEVDAPRNAGAYRATAVLDANSPTSKNFTLKEDDENFPTVQEFTVEKANLTVTPSMYRKSFGDADGLYTAGVQGMGDDGELQVVFERTISYSKEDWDPENPIDWRLYEQVRANPYPFDTVKFSAERNADNYNLILSQGEGSGLRIEARIINKVAPTFEKFYGEADPLFIENWDSGYFGIGATFTYIRATGNNAGSYSFISWNIDPDNAPDRLQSDYENFSIDFARDGGRNKFTIKPVNVRYQIKDVHKTFGAEDDPTQYEWRQIVESGVSTPSLTVTVHRDEGENAISSGYLIRLELSNPNYIAEIDRSEEGWGGRMYIERLQIETQDNIEKERLYNGTNIVTASSGWNNIPEAYRVATNFRVIATFSQSNVGEGIDIYVRYEVNDRVSTNYILPEDYTMEGAGKITPRTLKVWIDDFTMEYGEEIPEITLRYDNLIAGDQLGEVLTKEPSVNFGNFGAYAKVDKYILTLNDDGESLNYIFDVTDTATVTVERAPITVTVNEEKGTFVQTVSGQKNVELDNSWFLFGGLKNGDTATVLHTATLNSIEPGDTTITVEFSESENGNYYLLNRFVSVPAYLKPLPVITFDNVRAVYSGEPVSVTPNVTVIQPATGAVLTIGYAVRYVGVNYDSYTAPVNAGTYTAYVESVDDYYDTVRAEGTVQIDRASVRIVISGAMKQVYGEFTELTAVARGTDREFNLTVKYPFDSSVRPQAGTHTVQAVFDGNENYLPNASSAELKIEPRALRVTFSDFHNLVYNGQPQPLGATFTGILEGDTCEPVITYSSGIVPKDAGTYSATVTPSNSSYTISGNMMQVYTIQKRKLTITANGGTVNAGEKPDTTLVFDGFVNGEDVNNIEDLPNVSISGVLVGENNIYLSGGNDKNYDFVLETGSFTVVYEKATAEKSSGSVIWIVISCLLGIALLITIIALIARRKQENEYTKERSRRRW